MKKLYLGIDIGGTAVKMGIVTKLGEILYKNQYPVAFDNYKTPILTTVLAKTQEFLNSIQISPDTLSGIGISATGQIDTIQGMVAGTGGNIRNWSGTRLKEEFEKRYSLPITVVNDANCVALGEAWIGNAQNTKNAIILTIGTGLGGGLIVGSKVLLGHSGFAGELGHFSINHTGRPCTCGNLGCFEQYASMTALIKQVRTRFAGRLHPEGIHGLSIFTAIAEGNVEMEGIVDEWIYDIACGITSLVHIFNPELILIGGAVSVQKELFIDKLNAKLQDKLLPNFYKDCKLLSAKLGNDAGLIGAVYYLMESLK